MTDLRKVLNSKNLNQLKFACDILNIALPISSRKADIINLLYETLNKKETLDFVYSLLSDEEIENIKLASLNDKSNNLYDEKKLLLLHMIGYINIKNQILISDVIIDCINSPNLKLEEKRKRNNLINKYFTCFANLYGVVPVDKIAKIFNRYEDIKLKDSELEDIKNMTYIKPLPYVVDNEYLINREIFSYEECIDFLFELTENQDGKRYAILPKEELFRYLDPDYFEKTPQYRKMQTMLSLELGLSKADAEEIANDFAYMCKADVDFDFVFQYLEDKNIVFKDMEQCNRFMRAYADMQNNTRLWENCGNTPVETRKQMR
ncbi:MAG: hypothetical protein PUE46_03670 [Eubacteriales bacterium]|nr:hypothetical protein [Eubacteriales bacterium]